jgi:hypothetical protein
MFAGQFEKLHLCAVGASCILDSIRRTWVKHLQVELLCRFQGPRR